MGDLNKSAVLSRLRDLERMHERFSESERSAYARNIAAGRSDAFGSFADWIEAGEFDAQPTHEGGEP